MSEVLNTNRVAQVFNECHYPNGDRSIDDYVAIDAVTGEIGFFVSSLEANRHTIEAMLDELPTEFQQSDGGGWSFVNACLDKDGHMWTGSQALMAQLFALGMGIGKVTYLFPREMWDALPGGMPYVIIVD